MGEISQTPLLPRRGYANPTRSDGFTYIGLLVVIVVTGLLLSMAGRVWSFTERRNRETQLLFAGDQIRAAIAGYFANGHQYPASLEVLLADDRSPVATRYLRKLYRDPMTGKPDWQLLLASDGHGIMGVASRSHRKPIKRKGFAYVDAFFADSDCYCSWQFIYTPRRYGTPLPASGPGAPTQFAPGSLSPSPLNAPFQPQSSDGASSISERPVTTD